ncbi:MAG: glycosyltransferase [Flavobacteriaceae bacterium]|nr:glycosyltransferase [Flavobacteriaceae bacterium]
MKELAKNKILITPLNWGLGHATRCIPIIGILIKKGFIPIIASDGEALLLLQKEFPDLTSYTLPTYPIAYSKHPFLFKTNLLFKFLKFQTAYKAEVKEIGSIVKQENIQGIISDNRFGCYHPDIKSVYITHQIRVLAGIFTFLTSKIHQNIIKKFDECWIPDAENSPLSGRLSDINFKSVKTKYIGILSRFKPQKEKLKYDYLVLLSGPEPQRSLLERIMLKAFKNTIKRVLLIQGKIETHQKKSKKCGIEIVNFMTQYQLQQSIAESEVIIARSGYSTIMDLAVMAKKVFFIPTPGQTEQIYLAKKLSKIKIAPYVKQHQFKLANLDNVKRFTGFNRLSRDTEKLSQALSIFD